METPSRRGLRRERLDLKRQRPPRRAALVHQSTKYVLLPLKQFPRGSAFGINRPVINNSDTV